MQKANHKGLDTTYLGTQGLVSPLQRVAHLPRPEEDGRRRGEPARLLPRRRGQLGLLPGLPERGRLWHRAGYGVSHLIFQSWNAQTVHDYPSIILTFSPQDIRELYTYICMNYVDGDEIVLLGFSRGAFAARAVADMIASLGLLTYAGLDHFAAVFTDYQTMGDIKHHRHPGDFLLFPGQLTPYDGQAKGPAKIRWEAERKRQYRELLKAADYTRDTWKYDDDDDDDNHRKITVKAVGVWDTVGALGIPPVPMLGVKGSARQWRFTNSSVAREVEHAFQALALDEPRAVFRPALWERAEDDSPTNLKQVWFPGNHGNVGGGYRDQQIADITLACRDPTSQHS